MGFHGSLLYILTYLSHSLSRVEPKFGDTWLNLLQTVTNRLNLSWELLFQVLSFSMLHLGESRVTAYVSNQYCSSGVLMALYMLKTDITDCCCLRCLELCARKSSWRVSWWTECRRQLVTQARSGVPDWLSGELPLVWRRYRYLCGSVGRYHHILRLQLKKENFKAEVQLRSFYFCVKIRRKFVKRKRW